MKERNRRNESERIEKGYKEDTYRKGEKGRAFSADFEVKVFELG